MVRGVAAAAVASITHLSISIRLMIYKKRAVQHLCDRPPPPLRCARACHDSRASQATRAARLSCAARCGAIPFSLALFRLPTLIGRHAPSAGQTILKRKCVTRAVAVNEIHAFTSVLRMSHEHEDGREYEIVFYKLADSA